MMMMTFKIGTILLKKSRQHLATRARQQMPNRRSKHSSKKHITDFMIEFKVLVMKAETDDMHAIFLLKKNVRSNIIKTILEYLSIVVPELFKE